MFGSSKRGVERRIFYLFKLRQLLGIKDSIQAALEEFGDKSDCCKKRLFSMNSLKKISTLKLSLFYAYCIPVYTGQSKGFPIEQPNCSYYFVIFLCLIKCIIYNIRNFILTVILNVFNYGKILRRPKFGIHIN